MTKNPVLTISLLCSGRKEMKKCLDSLENLRKSVPSELILVDTGCDEEIKKLLYTYTDCIVPFTWCNDFSKARNAGLEKAQGEWFLFIDDDEWFLDTKEIEEFFLSEEYKNYGFASYIVRNYLDKEGITYEDCQANRLVCLSQGVRFRGIIHEILSPLQEPGKCLNSIAEHFGYVFQTPEEEKKHSERNRRLLQKALAENKEDIRIWTHLVQQYRAAKDDKMLQEFCIEALEKFEGRNDTEANRERGCFYCGLVEADINLEDYEAAERAYKKALLDKRNTDYCIARLMTFGVEIFDHKGADELVEQCCHRYQTLFEYYKTRPEELEQQDTFSVRLAFHQIMRNNMYCYQICLDLKRNNTSSLRQYFDDFDWDSGKIYMTAQFMPGLVKAMAELPEEEIFVHAVDVLANKPGMDNFWEEIDRIEEDTKVRRLVCIFSEVTDGAAGETAIKLRTMLQAEQKEDWEGFAVSLKEAVKGCPMLGGVLKRYAKIYAEKRMERAAEREKMERTDDAETTGNGGEQLAGESIEQGQAAAPEMQALAAQIKAQIPILLSQGMEQQALQILKQLKIFVPGDADINALEKDILKKLEDC